MATDGSWNVYVADGDNYRIQKFDASGTFLTTWGGAGTGNGQFLLGLRVATDASGSVYVTDVIAPLVSGPGRIQKFDANGTFLTAWGGPGSGNGQFAGPRGVAAGGSGNVYVADLHRIQRFDTSGTFLSTWGSQGSGNGQFDLPTGVATDGNGNVYVADAGNDRIQKFACP